MQQKASTFQIRKKRALFLVFKKNVGDFQRFLNRIQKTNLMYNLFFINAIRNFLIRKYFYLIRRPPSPASPVARVAGRSQVTLAGGVGVRRHAGMTGRFMCRRPYAAAAGCRSPEYVAEEPAMSTCPGARVPTPRSVRVTRDVAVYGAGGGRARG